MTTPNRTARRATWIALPLGLALVGALAFSPALAQEAATDATTVAPTTADAPPRAGAFLLRRGPDGSVTMRGVRGDPRADGRRDATDERRGAAARRLHERLDGDGGDGRADAFARWLGADAAGGPVVPGLVGRVADGTTVRLAFYAGAPDAGGAELASLTFVAGEGDAAAFRESVRSAAEGASHVVVDVLGRIVPLPATPPVDAAE